MGDVFKTLNLSDDNKIIRKYIAMLELYDAQKHNYVFFYPQYIKV